MKVLGPHCSKNHQFHGHRLQFNGSDGVLPFRTLPPIGEGYKRFSLQHEAAAAEQTGFMKVEERDLQQNLSFETSLHKTQAPVKRLNWCGRLRMSRPGTEPRQVGHGDEEEEEKDQEWVNTRRRGGARKADFTHLHAANNPRG